MGGGGKKRRRQDTVVEVSPGGSNKQSNGNSSGKKKKKKQPNNNNNARNRSDDDDDLTNMIANLAKQHSSESKSTSTKEERIEKRAAKKQKRQELQEQQKQKQQRHGNSQRTNNEGESKQKHGTTATKPASINKEDDMTARATHGTTTVSKKRLRKLATACKEALPNRKQKSNKKLFDGKLMESTRKRRKTKQLDDRTVQPRPRDYGGLGLARETLYLPLNDPSFSRRLEDEFQEHVDGFFGKQRTKAMKKQLDGQMLWRQLQNNKNNNPNKKLSKNQQQKVNMDGKKFANMTPDQRVEAMLKAGML